LRSYDFLLTLVFDRLFERFPNLRVASVENGSEYLPDLFRKQNSFAKKSTHWFQQHPLETFKNHVWINPFWEDDVNEVASYMGADRVIFGSDWPHIEGLIEPRNFFAELNGFNEADTRRIVYENTKALTRPQPT